MEIPLTRGIVAHIDDADYPIIAPYTWSASDKSGAVAWQGGVMIKMHRLLMGVTGTAEVLHLEKNLFHNRRTNVRVADRPAVARYRQKRTTRATSSQSQGRVLAQGRKALAGIDHGREQNALSWSVPQ